MSRHKYQVGDKVRIKNRAVFLAEFILAEEFEDIFDKFSVDYPDTIITIGECQEDDDSQLYYIGEETGHWSWMEKMIECQVFEPIESRYHILDL